MWKILRISGLIATGLAFMAGPTVQPSYALKNPAGVYCEDLGYTYMIVNGTGLCRLPNGMTVDAWDFLNGKIAEEHGFCFRQGLETVVKTGVENCRATYTSECAYCVGEDGAESEMARMMGLDLQESICGDGVCGMPDNHRNCPQDCPSGSEDLYCDAMADGVCDPDCEYNEDPDCPVVLPPNCEENNIPGCAEPDDPVFAAPAETVENDDNCFVRAAGWGAGFPLSWGSVPLALFMLLLVCGIVRAHRPRRQGRHSSRRIP